MIGDWDQNDAGNIRLDPLIDFQVAHLEEIGVGLRLELSSGQDESHKLEFVPQVALSVEAAQSLIHDLQLMVDYILTRRPEGPVN